ncbi:DUF6735 family protein [Haladaptatus halobius]|uniref:DUF6735 family protein n=1 Tax=Haladaptatus halobius TaxID=2884875 RepID=UPI0034A10860
MPFADDTGDRWTPAVEPAPEATALSFEDAATFDYRQFEAFYVVSLAWVATAYLPLWFGSAPVADGDSDTDVGALVAICDDRDAAHVRRWFRATRAVVRDMVRRGAVDERESTDYLDDRVAEWAGDHREVVSMV